MARLSPPPARTRAWTALLGRSVALAIGAGAALSVALSAALSAAPARAGDLTVFAAASTGTALSEIAEAWEAQTGHHVTLSLAGTSALARQIEAGAPADIFLAASPDWMDYLETRGLLAPDTRRDLLGNSLVLIGAAEAPPLALHGEDARAALDARLGSGRLALAFVDAVPAGIYARAALRTLGLWEAVADRIAQTDNVRAALALVALGAAPLGIVYASDARAEPRVSVLARLPAEAHPAIVYPMAALARADRNAATAFLDHLQGPGARMAFERQGFTLIAAE